MTSSQILFDGAYGFTIPDTVSGQIPSGFLRIPVKLMASKKDQLAIEELKLRATSIRWHHGASVAISLTRWVCAVAFMYWVYRAADSIAGETTSANVAVSGNFDLKFLASRYASQIIFALFGGGCLAHSVRTKQLYDKVVTKLQRLDKYEQKLDPQRSSSRVTNEDLLPPEPEL